MPVVRFQDPVSIKMAWSLAFSYLVCVALAYAGNLSNRESQFDSRSPAQPSYTAIPNGQPWYDTDGNLIENFGGGFLQVDSWFYWVGQAFSVNSSSPTEALVNMYKSQDLLNWEFIGDIINVYTLDIHGNQPLTYCQVQRPKLLYNENINKYVLWAHWEMAANFDASHVFVATADDVEGPYIVTEKNHFRPGAGNQEPSAMGDRVGGVITDYNSSPKNSANTTRPYQPNSGSDYPPKVPQYNNINPTSPDVVSYLSQSSGYGKTQIGSVYFNLTLKAVSVQMTPWDTSYYEKYSPYFSISASNYQYLVRYPTANRSAVTTTVFGIGDPRDERQALVAPKVLPGLDESSSSSTVHVHSGDAAFITCDTTGGMVFYTTDGSNPTANSTEYLSGTRISITGSPGTDFTVRAICSINGETSPVVTQKYTVVDNSTTVPIFRPIVNFPSGTYASSDPAFTSGSIKIYCPTYNTECFYTMDGVDPDPPVLGTNIGYRSRDLTVWQDPLDGTAYLVSASDNIFFRLWQLTDDFTDVAPDKEYDIYTDVSREAPAVIRHGRKSGNYVYLITSMQSGWYPNQGGYSRSANLSTGFSLPRDEITGYRNGNTTWSSLEPLGDASTFGSQSTYILDIGTVEDPQYIFVGDRYYEPELWQSTYIFIPLTINDTGIAVTGFVGSGLMSLQFTPLLEVDLTTNSIITPTWKLLSLNKPVNATASVQPTASQLAAGTYNFSASVANDGVDYDLSPYDSVEQYYAPVSVPFYWQVDLEQVYDMAWIGLSFMSVGGSDAVNRYTLQGSVDGLSWDELVNNTGNSQPGFRDHVISGSYRYIRLNDYSVWDIDHNKEADWEVGVYEVYVYGSEPSTSVSSTSTTTTTTVGTSTSAPVTTTTSTIKCNHDNCLRQLIRSSTAAQTYCATYTAAINTATTNLPFSNCQANPSRISSACSCIATAAT